MKNKLGWGKLLSLVLVIALVIICSLSMIALAEVTGSYTLVFYPNNGTNAESYIYGLNLPDDNNVTLVSEVAYDAPSTSVMFGGWALNATAELPTFMVGDYAYKVVEAAISADSSIADGATIPVYTIWVDTPAVSAKKVEDAQNAAAEAEDKLTAVQNDLNTANNNLKETKEGLAAAELKAKTAEDQAKIAEGKIVEAEKRATAAEKEASTFKATVLDLNSRVGKYKGEVESSLQPQPMTVKAKTVTASAKKALTIKKNKAFSVKNAKGKVTFYKLSGNDKISVTKKGVVKVKKGLEEGKTYKVKVLVVAAGGKIKGIKYAPGMKTVTLKIKIKKEEKK